MLLWLAISKYLRFDCRGAAKFRLRPSMHIQSTWRGYGWCLYSCRCSRNLFGVAVDTGCSTQWNMLLWLTSAQSPWYWSMGATEQCSEIDAQWLIASRDCHFILSDRRLLAVIVYAEDTRRSWKNIPILQPDSQRIDKTRDDLLWNCSAIALNHW